MSRNCSFVATWCDGAKIDCLLTSTGGKECDGILWSFLHRFKKKKGGRQPVFLACLFLCLFHHSFNSWNRSKFWNSLPCVDGLLSRNTRKDRQVISYYTISICCFLVVVSAMFVYLSFQGGSHCICVRRKIHRTSPLRRDMTCIHYQACFKSKKHVISDFKLRIYPYMGSLNAMVSMLMLFNFILGLNFIFLCFGAW